MAPVALQALMFFPRGGSAQVVRYLAREVARDGRFRPRVVAGSVGPAGGPGDARDFFAGLDLVAVDYDAALDAPDPQVIRWLVEVFRTSGRPIAVPVYRDGRGNPVLFAASLFDELRSVEGDRGGRDVIARHPQRVAEVPVDAQMPADIDTPEDYEAARRRAGEPRP